MGKKSEKYLVSAIDSNIIILYIQKLRLIEIKYMVLGITAQWYGACHRA